MSTPSPSARAYRRLGYLALAHAVALLGLVFLLFKGGIEATEAWRLRPWIASVTLWFFWPVALIVHFGRSVLRFTVIMLLAAVVLFPTLRFYDRIAPREFGLPDGVSVTPWSMWQYFSAYRAGRADAEKDVAAGILAIEEYGFGAGFGPGVDLLCDRYQIEVRPIAQCAVDESILGHAAGYNAVSEREIDRRVGSEHLRATREEGYRRAVEQSERLERYFKDLANRLSSFPSDSKITLESVQVWTDGEREIGAAAEQELAQSVRAVEKFIAEIIPPTPPAFELRVSGTMTPTEAPIFEAPSASLSCPRPVYDKIYKGLPNLLLPQWSSAKVFVALNYKVRETN
jgi:hypothetical protein